MQWTGYIRKENWDKFSGEPKKSDLINLLLSRHYEYFHPGTLIEAIEDDKDFDASIVGNKDEDWDGPMFRDKKRGKL